MRSFGFFFIGYLIGSFVGGLSASLIRQHNQAIAEGVIKRIYQAPKSDLGKVEGLRPSA